VARPQGDFASPERLQSRRGQLRRAPQRSARCPPALGVLHGAPAASQTGAQAALVRGQEGTWSLRQDVAAYEIEFTATAERAFRKLPDEVQRRFSRALKVLRHDPRRRRPGCDVGLLSGAANAWRLRVGDYRGIYAIEGSRLSSRDSDTAGTCTGHRLGPLRTAGGPG